MSGPVHAVLFDLDDTLYPEMDFVRGAMGAVAAWMAPRVGAPPAAVLDRLSRVLDAEGRGAVFNRVLDSYGALTEDRVRACLHAYRAHRPALRLHDDADAALACLRRAGIRLGIVTDGEAVVQRAKVDALGLEARVDAVVLSDLLGTAAWKPAGDAYRVALECLGAAPQAAVYVGDNPVKDFVWPNAHGMRTVLVRRGTQRPPEVPPDHRARFEVRDLRDLPALLGVEAA